MDFSVFALARSSIPIGDQGKGEKKGRMSERAAKSCCTVPTTVQ